MNTPVYCDPQLPEDWDEREARPALERQAELAQRDSEGIEPQLLQMFRRAAAL
jgi:hypothetical protein